MVSVAAVVAWACLLPRMQVPVQNRTRYESLLKEGRTADAVRELCSRERNEYPPVWSPPPRIEAGEWSMEDALPAIAAAIRSEARVPEWVGEVYGEKMVRWTSRELGRYWDSVTGYRRDRRFAHGKDDWVAPTDEERVEGWKRVDAADRDGVRLCLEFIRDRMKGLASAERDEVERWIQAVEKVEAEELEKSKSGR